MCLIWTLVRAAVISFLPHMCTVQSFLLQGAARPLMFRTCDALPQIVTEQLLCKKQLDCDVYDKCLT